MAARGVEAVAETTDATPTTGRRTATRRTLPTQRTLVMLRAGGYSCAITEHWNPHARIRQDLFGAFDVIALHPSWHGVLGVQITTSSNLAARRTKLMALNAVRVWLQAGNRIWLIGWRKGGARGKRKTWDIRVLALTLEDLP